MDKRARMMVLGAAALVVALAGVYLLWPSGDARPTVDPAIVEAAAEASRQAQEQSPPPAEEPKREGRARPGAMGIGGGSGTSEGR